MRILLSIAIITFIFFINKKHFDPTNLYTEIPRGSEETAEIAPILQQRFFYLGEGSQIYAFLSNDGKTVLKLFKAKHNKPYKWHRIFQEFKTKDWSQSQYKWKLKFQDTCRRYRMAFMDLKEETGLIYIHFQHTPLPLLVELRDKYTFQIDLAKYPFILQKKAVLAPDYIRKNPVGVQALKDFFQIRTLKGFSDPRQTLSKNYGFVEDQPIQIDPGKIEPFTGDCEMEIEKIQANVDEWASRL